MWERLSLEQSDGAARGDARSAACIGLDLQPQSRKRVWHPALMPHKILLIGPDGSLRASRKHLLERAGYVVKTATDHNALERLDENGFQMVALRFRRTDIPN